MKNADSQSGTGQTITATKQYDAFGNTITSTGTWKGPFGYAGSFGYQEDADSSLKLLGHRYYDASTGRFLTRDPIKAGRNWYVYCDSNPISRADPTGKDWHNPSQVRVDPAFNGTVIAIGEPGPNKPQVAVSLGPGQQTNPQMDVDLVIVKRPGKPDIIYFIGGNKLDKSGKGDWWIIDEDGDICGPPFVL